ncbi:hypothetical protein OG730_04810 [Streptomyces sp. NBC_01298]|uniref:hypothetical protein n=1 Tax=Streptomyces sp. NBC_01298 TaxID=2903817 RepID=UPI002E146A48|nr:hypothetical protein OG730_04810 [Streptomyces sp. NBC_01298]
MTDHGPHMDEMAPPRAAKGCASPLRELDPEWRDPQLLTMGRVAHGISTQQVVVVAGAPGAGKRATALRLLAATEVIGNGVASELADRRVRDLRKEGWTVAGPHRPADTTPPTPLALDSQFPPSSQALRDPVQPHLFDAPQGQLVRTLQRMSNAELAQLGRKLARLRRQIQRALDRLLGIGSYEFVSHVPPHDTSPCGLLRMASPEIPRGPQLGLHLDAPVHSWALAA